MFNFFFVRGFLVFGLGNWFDVYVFGLGNVFLDLVNILEIIFLYFGEILNDIDFSILKSKGMLIWILFRSFVFFDMFFGELNIFERICLLIILYGIRVYVGDELFRSFNRGWCFGG